MPVPLWKPILFQLIMLVLTALTTTLSCAAEVISDNRLERLEEEGDERAGELRARVDMIENAQPAIHMAAWIVTFFAGFLGALGFIEPVYAWAASSGVAAAVMCGIVLMICCLTQIFAVLLPRRLCAVKPDELALSSFKAVEFVGGLLLPLTWLNALVVRIILKLMRVDIEETTEKVTEDEILAMVDMGEEKGAIESNEKEMITNIFEFNNKPVAACMTHRTDMTAIAIDASEEEIMTVIEETGLSRYPVYDKDMDDIVGVLFTRHYLLNARCEQPKLLKDIMREVYFVPESMKTDRLFHEMQARKSHMAIVVDEYGGTSGLITMEDLLEEIVGDIYDELDPQAEQELTALADGSWRVAGSMQLSELCEALDIEAFDTDEYDTLGGLIFSQLTEIPEDGSHPEMECGELEIKVDELTDRHVEWAIVRKKPKAEEARTA